MRLAGLDQYAHLHSPLHSWKPTYKLIGLGALILAFSTIRSLETLPLMIGITVGLFWLSRLPLTFWHGRLKIPGFFLLLVAGLLPFLSGPTVLLQLGPLKLYQEGSLALLLITGRFVCILTLGLILFGTAPFLSMIRAMHSLGLPPLLADMMLLAYRYLYEIGDDLTAMATAMRLRGFQSKRFSRKSLPMLVSLAGSLLVRSFDRSEHVYKAMRLRGYGARTASSNLSSYTHTPKSRAALSHEQLYDLGGLIVTISLAITLIGLDYYRTSGSP